MFLALAALSWWRGHVVPPLVMGSAGTLLLVPGLLFPSILAPIERGWMAVAAVLGAVNTRVILTLVYVAVVTPIGMLRRWRHDPLDRRLGADTASYWIRRPRQPLDAASYRKQF